jgi:hypothetical protein
MNRDHVVDGHEMRAAVALDGQMTRKAPRRRARPTERRIGSATERCVERDVSGKSSNRNIPEIQNATTATMMARRSVDSDGAPGDDVTYG